MAVHREEGAYVGRLERSDECGPGMGKGDAPPDPAGVPGPEHDHLHRSHTVRPYQRPRRLRGTLEVDRSRKRGEAGDVSAGRVALWEISKITDPKQRGHLADILETLSDYQYLLGRTSIAKLEFEAGIAKVMGEDVTAGSLMLVRPTMGQVFGRVGGVNIGDAEGNDVSDSVRVGMSDAEFGALKGQS